MNNPDNVTRFYICAKEYCLWAEGLPQEKEIDVHKALQLVVTLYQAILYVPDGQRSDAEVDIAFRKSEEINQWFKRFPFQYYQIFFNPVSDEADDPVVGDITDDLLDIYKDMKEGLLYYEKGAISDAAWNWKFLFLVHWGKHAAGAIYAMHDYLTNKK